MGADERPVIALVLACTEGDPVELDRGPTDVPERAEAALADMTLWGPPTGPDPFEDAPVDGVCPIGGTYVEGSTFEVNTGLCTSLWAEQPLLDDLVPGDVIELVFWHSVLVADPPADGHLALAVDGEPVFEARIPIPSDYAAYTEQVEVDRAADAGASLGLHLHNHGANTWNLLRITRLAAER